jgi:catalase
VIAQLRNVAPQLAEGVAEGLGLADLPAPLPTVLGRRVKPEVTKSEKLSLFALPGSDGIKTRKVAILVAAGSDGEAATGAHAFLSAQGAVPRFLGISLGPAGDLDEAPIDVEISMEAAPSVTWDALIIPGGEEAIETLGQHGLAREFLREQYRHCKPILLLGDAHVLLEKAGLESGEPGVLVSEDEPLQDALESFVELLTKHRVFERESPSA